MDEKASQRCDFFFFFFVLFFFYYKAQYSKNLWPTTLPKQPQNTPLPDAPPPPPSLKDIKIIMI